MSSAGLVVLLPLLGYVKMLDCPCACENGEETTPKMSNVPRVPGELMKLVDGFKGTVQVVSNFV